MITLTRAAARTFRSALRQLAPAGGRRGPSPWVQCRAGRTGLTLEANQDGLAVRYHTEGEQEADALAVRADALGRFEGPSETQVSLETVARCRVVARWSDRGAPQQTEFEAAAPGAVPPFPAEPKTYAPMPAGFLKALAEAARTAGKPSGRYALSRVLLRGRDGAVVATDARQLLVHGGFGLPWSDDLLVPAVPAFGSVELPPGEAAGVARAAGRVFVCAGPWTFALPIDAAGRYPDVDPVIPRPQAARARLRIGPNDAEALAAALTRLPGGRGEQAPVTLDLATPPAVRAGGDGGAAEELVLSDSSATGRPVRVVCDRRHLRRALGLGFTEVEVAGPDKPLACRDGDRVYVWMALDQDSAAKPARRPAKRGAAAAPPSSAPAPARPAPGRVRPGGRGLFGRLVAAARVLTGLVADARRRERADPG